MDLVTSQLCQYLVLLNSTDSCYSSSSCSWSCSDLMRMHWQVLDPEICLLPRLQDLLLNILLSLFSFILPQSHSPRSPASPPWPPVTGQFPGPSSSLQKFEQPCTGVAHAPRRPRAMRAARAGKLRRPARHFLSAVVGVGAYAPKPTT